MMDSNQKKQDRDRTKIQSQDTVSQNLGAIATPDLEDNLENSDLKDREKSAKPDATKNNFDQPLALSQSPKWIQTILWTLLGSISVGLVWASVAKIEESVPAQGKLEPQGAVKEVRVPSNGVLKEVLIKEGDKVEKGKVLLRIDATAAQAQLDSLQKLRKSLQQENQFYQDVLSGKPSVIDPTRAKGIPKRSLRKTNSIGFK
jgi:hemolysin D